MTINDKDDRLAVTMFFPDSRVVDLDSAIRIASGNRWLFHQVSKGIDHLEYRVTEKESFLTEVRFTHGLEPPTRVTFENRSPETGQHLPANKHTLLTVASDFLEECAARGLVSQTKKEVAVKQLLQHDPELSPAR